MGRPLARESSGVDQTRTFLSEFAVYVFASVDCLCLRRVSLSNLAARVSVRAGYRECLQIYRLVFVHAF